MYKGFAWSNSLYTESEYFYYVNTPSYGSSNCILCKVSKEARHDQRKGGEHEGGSPCDARRVRPLRDKDVPHHGQEIEFLIGFIYAYKNPGSFERDIFRSGLYRSALYATISLCARSFFERHDRRELALAQRGTQVSSCAVGKRDYYAQDVYQASKK